MQTADDGDQRRILEILGTAKGLAREYRALTGKPLGITGEVAEYEAARLLGVELTPARQAGYDAVRPRDGRRYQIKGRRILPGCTPGQWLGAIKVKGAFDAVLMVLIDEAFEAFAIYEADREPVIAALRKPGSVSRNVRGAVGVNKFKCIGRLVWPQQEDKPRKGS